MATTVDLSQIYASQRRHIEAVIFSEVFHLDDGHATALNLLKAGSERVPHRDVSEML